MSRNITRIILHHTASENDTVESINSYHNSLGWNGIGYHYVVYKDGTVHKGRNIELAGAHTSNNNSDSIGIVCVGNFENRLMDNLQLEGLKNIVKQMKKTYNISNDKVFFHKDFNATACPGKNFPSKKNILEEVETMPENFTVRQEGDKLIVSGPLYNVFKNNNLLSINRNGNDLHISINNGNSSSEYKVQVITDALNIRKSPNSTSTITGVITDKGIYTIIATSGTWGQLKSGAGWISLNYTKRI